MHAAELSRAVAAAGAISTASGLTVDDAVVLQDSNRVILRLLPCDVVARVAPVAYQESAGFEVALARRLAETGSPVAALEPRIEPRVHVRDGFATNFWTYYEPSPREEVAPADYAHALERLHAGLRAVNLPAPHFTDRVAQAQRIVASHEQTPALTGVDRKLLADTLQHRRQAIVERGAAEQMLHGEPHPGNLLDPSDGPRFIDLETCCRGPVEFDLAHAPEAVGDRYPGIDHALLGECRIIVLAMVAAWRWDRDDDYPNGHTAGLGLLDTLRAEEQY